MNWFCFSIWEVFLLTSPNFPSLLSPSFFHLYDHVTLFFLSTSYRMSRNGFRLCTNFCRSDARRGQGMFWGPNRNMYLWLSQQSPAKWNWLGMGRMLWQHWLRSQIRPTVHWFRWKRKGSAFYHESAQQRGWKTGESIYSIFDTFFLCFVQFAKISNLIPSHVTFSFVQSRLQFDKYQHQFISFPSRKVKLLNLFFCFGKQQLEH